MAKRSNPVVLSKKERAPELGHRDDPHQRLRLNFKQKAGHLICKQCEAVGFQKHWYIDSPEAHKLMQAGEAELILCPGCTRVRAGIHQGEVILEPSSSIADGQALMALIRHTESRCWHNNPFARIASMVTDHGRIVIRTTTRWLATRIGKEVNKAYKGELTIKPVPREKFVRVWWSHRLTTKNK